MRGRMRVVSAKHLGVGIARVPAGMGDVVVELVRGVPAQHHRLQPHGKGDVPFGRHTVWHDLGRLGAEFSGHSHREPAVRPGEENVRLGRLRCLDCEMVIDPEQHLPQRRRRLPVLDRRGHRRRRHTVAALQAARRDFEARKAARPDRNRAQRRPRLAGHQRGRPSLHLGSRAGRGFDHSRDHRPSHQDRAGAIPDCERGTGRGDSQTAQTFRDRDQGSREATRRGGRSPHPGTFTGLEGREVGGGSGRLGASLRSPGKLKHAPPMAKLQSVEKRASG